MATFKLFFYENNPMSRKRFLESKEDSYEKL